MKTASLWDRVKIAYRFVRYGKGNVRIMTCGKCGNAIISPISEHPSESEYIREGKHIDLVWSEFSQCRNCGAVCQEIELWNFEGNPAKIDNSIMIKRKEENQNVQGKNNTETEGNGI